MIIRDTVTLHAAFGERLGKLMTLLRVNGIPLEVYESWRSPVRQGALWAIGRSPGVPGHHVTRAQPWESFHQYGLAVDLVFRVDGSWSWNEPEPGMWGDFTRLAKSCDLRTLSFERPHVEFPVGLGSLRAGQYPPGGGEGWEAQLESFIHELPKEAPPLSTGRPPLLGVQA
jgi:peptidoglycan L-alanyl-D-glutamate endopeptidase CwlK